MAQGNSRVNEQITAGRVLVIDEIGTKIGLMMLRDAIIKAKEKGLDLVEVAAETDPPVCRIMDFGKQQYQKQKRDRDGKKKQVHTQVKELKLRIKTEEHDIQTKLRHIRRFLEHGDKVKITIMFRGREMAHQDLGKELLIRIVSEIKDQGAPADPPKLEGKNLSVVVIPGAKAHPGGKQKSGPDPDKDKENKPAEEMAQQPSAENEGVESA